MKWGCLMALGGLLIPIGLIFGIYGILQVFPNDAFQQFMAACFPVIMAIAVFTCLIGLIIAFVGLIRNG